MIFCWGRRKTRFKMNLDGGRKSWMYFITPSWNQNISWFTVVRLVCCNVLIFDPVDAWRDEKVHKFLFPRKRGGAFAGCSWKWLSWKFISMLDKKFGSSTKITRRRYFYQKIFPRKDVFMPTLFHKSPLASLLTFCTFILCLRIKIFCDM